MGDQRASGAFLSRPQHHRCRRSRLLVQSDRPGILRRRPSCNACIFEVPVTATLTIVPGRA